MTGRFFLAAVSAVAVLAVPKTAAAGDFVTQNLRYTTSALQGRTSSRLALPVGVPSSIAPIIVEAAKKHGVDPKLVAAVAFRESRFDPHAVSRIGAEGVMQLMPRTARAMGVSDSFDARQNIQGGTRYLKQMLDTFHGDIDLALAAYNAGPEAVKKLGVGATQEAVEYVAAIRSYYIVR